MPGERFVETQCLSYETVSRIDRTVAAAQRAVEADPEKAGRLTIRIYFTANEAGEVIPMWSMHENYGSKKLMELGRVRNGQLVMLGTDVLSDTPPEEDSEHWKDTFLAVPGGRR